MVQIKIKKEKIVEKMDKKFKKMNETLKELLIGIVIYGIMIEVAGICFFRDKLYFSIGLWIGIVLALASAIHMWRGLNIGLELGDAASKYVLSQNMIRYGVIVAVFGGICFWNIGNPLAAFAGIMGLKAGAYLQPFTHKIISKLKRR